MENIDFVAVFAVPPTKLTLEASVVDPVEVVGDVCVCVCLDGYSCGCIPVKTVAKQVAQHSRCGSWPRRRRVMAKETYSCAKRDQSYGQRDLYTAKPASYVGPRRRRAAKCVPYNVKETYLMQKRPT